MCRFKKEIELKKEKKEGVNGKPEKESDDIDVEIDDRTEHSDDKDSLSDSSFTLVTVT